MKIKQWEDKGLSIFSYAILSEAEKKVFLIDPVRDISEYEKFAVENKAVIAGIIETHPHADFVSGHLELSQKHNAVIYVHKLVGAHYNHHPVEHLFKISSGNIQLEFLHTPGHSPDSICVLLYHHHQPFAVFTGDTLFAGDCGRPDLRESAGYTSASAHKLAEMMYDSLTTVLAQLPDEVVLYPGHGAGSLCGKGPHADSLSNIGKEKLTNWSLRPMMKDQFIKELLHGQPFIPCYFPHTVEVNRKGAAPFHEIWGRVNLLPEIRTAEDVKKLKNDILIIDAREEKLFKAGHLKGSVNIMEGLKFETWLGTVVCPGEMFYLTAKNQAQLKRLIERIAFIGYENQIEGAFLLDYVNEADPEFDIENFKQHPEQYTILDIRNSSEIINGKSFTDALALPLGNLPQKLENIPSEKPIVVHCAAGYRSAIGSSLLRARLNGSTHVFDLGSKVKELLN